MLSRILPVFLAALMSFSVRSQQTHPASATTIPSTADLAPAVTLPSPEEFVNAVFSTVVDSTAQHYYLVVGTDSCRFLKYNYEDWIQYHLSEPLTFNILNELSEKVYLSRYPYFWKQTRLEKAICITRRQADSILSYNPTFIHGTAKNYVFSFSLPQFTDDGQYAVIDLNIVCGPVCGEGRTCIFRHTARGAWKLVGEYTNWSS